MKSKSVCEAAGKPTSISLYPIWTSSMNMRRLRSGDIGSIRAWLPSRRSTAHQRGAASTCRVGHWRSGRSTANCFWYGAYRSKGIALGRCVAKGLLTVDMWLLQRKAKRGGGARQLRDEVPAWDGASSRQRRRSACHMSESPYVINSDCLTLRPDGEMPESGG